MNTFNLKFRFLFMLGMVLFFSSAVMAQNGRHHYNHNNYNYGYNNSRHYYPVRFTTPYNYRPNYYYRPVYRSRPYYGPIYRLPHYVHFGPSFGLRINILPFGYSTIYIGPSPYYYNQGIFYRPYSDGRGYEVTTPPLGAEVSRLPADAKVIVIDGEKYYELGGTFYQEEIYSNNKLQYKVVGTDGVLNTGNDNQPSQPSANNAPPVNNNDNVLPATGTRVDKLPADSKVVVINKEKYYLSADGVYYKEIIDGNN